MDSLPLFISAFRLSPEPAVIVHDDAPDFTVWMANDAYLAATRLKGESIQGKSLLGDGHLHSANMVFDGGSVVAAALSKAAKERKVQIVRNQVCVFGPQHEAKPPRCWDFTVTPLDGGHGQAGFLHLHLKETGTMAGRPGHEVAEEGDGHPLMRKSRLLMAVAGFMSAMLQYERDDWNKAIDKAFGIVGEAVEVDRVYYFENSTDPASGRRFTSQRIEWSSDRAEPQIDNPLLQNVPFEWFTGMVPILENINPLYGHVSQLPSGSMKQLLAQQQIKSFLFFPITVSDSFFGFIGFDECQRERDWTPDEIAFMQTLATNLASAIEKRKALEAVRESQRQFQSVISNMPGITYRCLADKAWTMLFISDEVQRMTGYPASDFTSGKRTFASIIHPDDVELTYRLFEHIHRREGFHLQYRLVDAEGEVIWVEERGMGIYDAEGNVLWVDGVIMNITEQKKREMELNISNERFRLVMKAANEAIIDWDIVQDEAVLGNGFQDLFGHDAGSAGGRLWTDNIHEGDRDRVLAELRNTTADRELGHFYSEFQFYRANREVAFVQLRGVIVRDEAGNPVRLVGSMLDLTETNRRIQKIEQQNQRLREIAWIQSHVVRAPLARIMALVDLIELESKKGDAPMELLSLMINSAVELDRIINEIVQKTADIETA